MDEFYEYKFGHLEYKSLRLNRKYLISQTSNA
ncbi:hypothetical protein IM793_23975 [Pedobacter sp. MR2016-19]|nr:hypothetical protein [Pedobacter sp. MR2016-19]